MQVSLNERNINEVITSVSIYRMQIHFNNKGTTESVS